MLSQNNLNKLKKEIDQIYYYKYIKYKTKYLELKNKLSLIQDSKQLDNDQYGGQYGGHYGGQYGGQYSGQLDQNKHKHKHLIIHISGPSGSGKTTLGTKLKEKFGNKIIVKDIDDLRYEFIQSSLKTKKLKTNKNNNLIWNEKLYQEYIDEFINLIVNKKKSPLIFVGLNHMPWWNKNLYYNMHSQYNFYIKLNSNIIFKQKCKRFIDDVFVNNKHQDKLINNIIKNEKETLKALQTNLAFECGYENIIKETNMWNHDYRKQGYKFMSRKKIFDKVSAIIKKHLKIN
jgi:adenylate kinase family enzyme